MHRRLFALSRMVEVLLYNLSRLHDFWPLLLDHIVELLSDNRAPARLAAIEALSRALVGALATCLQPHDQVCDRHAQSVCLGIPTGQGLGVCIGAFILCQHLCKPTDQSQHGLKHAKLHARLAGALPLRRVVGGKSRWLGALPFRRLCSRELYH